MQFYKNTLLFSLFSVSKLQCSSFSLPSFIDEKKWNATLQQNWKNSPKSHIVLSEWIHVFTLAIDYCISLTCRSLFPILHKSDQVLIFDAGTWGSVSMLSVYFCSKISIFNSVRYMFTHSGVLTFILLYGMCDNHYISPCVQICTLSRYVSILVSC